MAVARVDNLESSWHGLLPSLDTVEASISREADNNLPPRRSSYKPLPKEPPGKPWVRLAGRLQSVALACNIYSGYSCTFSARASGTRLMERKCTAATAR